MKTVKHCNGVKHTKYFNGVKLTLASPKNNVRIKDGHGCVVQVGMLQFHSLYQAKRFIKSLAPSF